ncbi:putative transcriptional regulator [Marinimicrobium koreense]|uniref:UPF0301 protein EDC38_2084 n=1 Tax=Marinimicrobium koreense TaxID=306545 RepID=A0A3N1P418_9GAMM|nr:YqgE/AlgH family protein [Marinimicrobium koreense]ROQ21460.1 putative transcriptional regulator [Marinimicrobium koreense]
MNEKSPADTEKALTAGSLRDHFLIAMPGMLDRNFAHSITYICEHSDEGAMGLVLNNAMPLTLGDIFSQLELGDEQRLGDRTVLAGGPVQVERGFVVHNDTSRWQSTLSVADDVSLSASRDILEALAEGRGPENFIIALGYAGWEAGQLEDEIAANAWLTMPADRHILFHTPSEQRWAAAANHLGFDLNLISATAGHA